MAFTIDVRDAESHSIVRLTGELDMATAPRFHAVLDELVAAGQRCVLVDLYELSFCDSAGLNAFVQGDKQCAGHGGWLRLTRAQGHVARVIELSGVDEVLVYRRPAVRVFESLEALRRAAGERLGHGPWRLVDQERVDAFAAATGDHQWIHVDPERAAAGPYGTTIAHGYLVLALLPSFAAEVYRVDGVRMAVNYGLNRVRFPAPLPTGSRVRGAVRLLSADEVPGGLHLVSEITVEREGGTKPCCVAETVTRLYS